MFEKVGLITEEMVEGILPSLARRSQGPYALSECFQEIPCSPCFTACKPGAVEPFEDINNRPNINYLKCTGCAQCVSACPGLACFVINETFSETESTLKIPYEFLPLPQNGQIVDGLDRQGKFVCKVRVIKVQSHKALDHTNIITIAVPKDKVLSVRNIRFGVTG